MEDPLPCLNNFSGQVYSSPAPGGPYCTNPAFIPTLITPPNFTPTSSDSITLVYTNGTTVSVPYTAGTGWVIPTSPAVAEIDVPPFAEEGSNSAPLRCCSTCTGTRPRRSAPHLHRLWQELPEKARHEALTALGRMVTRALRPPPDGPEVSHEDR